MHIAPDLVQILFADAQPTLVAGSRTNPPEAIEAASSVLARCAALLAIPVTYSVAEQPNGKPRLIDVLTEVASDGAIHPRHCASPFMDEALVAALNHHGRKTLVIAGFAGEVAVFHAALDAMAAGYSVMLAVDAIGSLSTRTETAVFQQIVALGGVTTSVASLVTMFAPEFSQPPGDRVIAAVRSLSS